MDPITAAVGGSIAGLVGAALAHLSSSAAGRLGSEGWLRGPFGPPFFNIALYTGVFYAAIGLAASRRAFGAAVGFFGPFLTIVLPMFVLSRYGGWEVAHASEVSPWKTVTLAVYIVAIWGTIAALGALSARGRRWRGMLAAVLGSVAGYLAVVLAEKAAPGLLNDPGDPRTFLPGIVNLLDGLFSGLGLCLALSLEDKLSRRSS